MAFTIPPQEELRDRYLRALAAELPDLRASEGTLPYVEAGVISGLVRDGHAHQASVGNNVTPVNADDDGVLLWGTAKGITRKTASVSRKASALEVRGTVGTVVAAGDLLTHRSQLTYQLTEGATVGADGTVKVSIESVSTGASTRLSKGETLRFTSAPAGIDQAARLVLDIDEGGDDLEPIGQWRDRILLRMRESAQGGNRGDYEEWAREIVSVAAAYIYKAKPGLGWVSVAVLGDGSGASRIVSSGIRDEVYASLTTDRPITDRVRVMETIERKVAIDVQMTAFPGYDFDWDSSSGFEVSAWNASTRTLTFASDLPNTLSVGDLLTIVPVLAATVTDGRPCRVSAISSATAVIVAPVGDFAEPVDFTPIAGDPIYASSETARAARTAILDGYTVCSTDAEVYVAGVNQLGPANPNGAYGDWASDITRGGIEAAARSGGRAATVIVVSPATDEAAEEFAFPDDDTVELLTPGRVIVRPA